jgi:hypothetical protein
VADVLSPDLNSVISKDESDETVFPVRGPVGRAGRCDVIVRRKCPVEGRLVRLLGVRLSEL